MEGSRRPPAIEIGPERAEAAVIWLHGLGADGHDFVPIVPELRLPASPAVRFIFPHADLRPVTINMGLIMRAWYDIRDLSLDDRGHDPKGIAESAARIRELIDRERARGIAPERIVLAGFSQGGAMALHTGLRYPERLAGIVGLSCYLLFPDRLAEEASQANRGLPVFLGHGTMDPMVPLAAGEQAAARLREAGYAVTFHTYPVPHAVHPQEIADVGAWLSVRLRSGEGGRGASEKENGGSDGI
ncbi:MAG: carboxylesterase [Acidobacteria bacterium]|nr:MAG: carboxylesterase [Acidobacteriota bacterium]